MRFVIVFLLSVASLVGQHATVPDNWKAGPPHFGPYVQAPPNCGAKWYLVSPFNQQPWLKECSDFVDPKKRELPAGFVDVFGPEPARLQGESTFAYLPRLNKWLQSLQYFRGSGLPADFDQESINRSLDLFRSWGISEPKFYVGRYGPMARFQGEDMEFSAYGTVFFPHVVISQIQSKQFQSGTKPARIHPFVPPFLYETEEKAVH